VRAIFSEKLIFFVCIVFNNNCFEILGEILYSRAIDGFFFDGEALKELAPRQAHQQLFQRILAEPVWSYF
jgi:hypothetical protein